MLTVVILVASYIAAQMLADIASLKIVFVAGFSMDAGTLIYPFTFTIRDLVHKAIGVRATRALIVTAALINLLMAGLFWLVAQLPPDQSVGSQTAFSEVLSPVWRIVIASIVAEALSEMTDTEIYRLWVSQVTKRYQWTRVLLSNIISVPLDSLAFCWLAFGGVYSVSVVWSIFWSNVLLKIVITMISLPGIYLVKDKGTIDVI